MSVPDVECSGGVGPWSEHISPVVPRICGVELPSIMPPKLVVYVMLIMHLKLLNKPSASALRARSPMRSRVRCEPLT